MKRIQLTEGQLYRLIEQALNELSYQTYMNATNKKKINESYKDNKALFDSGAGLMLAQKTAEACNMSVDDAKYEVNCIIDNLSCDARKGNLSYRHIADELAGLGLDMEDENIEAVNQLVQAYQKPEWDDDEFSELDYDWGEEGDYNPNESLSRRVTESVLKRLNERDKNDEEDEDDEPQVQYFADLLEWFDPEVALNELEQYLSKDDEDALIDSLISDWNADYDGIDRENYQYLTDLTELRSPEYLLSDADSYFGRDFSSKAAQDIMHILWWN